ncbi:MAG TPA: cyclopropane-fatty-acyl-phospholipid synthase family protein [Casimicrobiaceae bacterium]|nr:cyclopropane-fatty-acyl-phospholipid synthase family protein [Casimicrobiaceae bacterium]
MAQTLRHLIASRYDGRNVPVTLVLPDGARVPLSTTPAVDIVARSWKGLRALAAPALGSLARAYVRGDLDFTGSSQRMIGIAESMVGSVQHGRDRARARFKGWLHRKRANRLNIAHHYDVSNAFYRMWLDERMVYSCAYFRQDGDTLEAAQLQKLEHICRKLRLAPGERFLDIGCGWGALLFHAAERYGVDGTGITLSQNQFDQATREIAARGLTGRVRVELRDYLDLPDDPVYDKVASVGMFEHVGVNRFPRYFGKIHSVLKPGGLVLNHGITLNLVDAESLGSGISDFVEDYVFPGGQLTHVARVVEGMAREGLETIDAESLREHYARTLWHWVERLEANAEAARAEVGDARYRIWRIYMAGSAHAFDRGWLSLWQVLAGKPLTNGRLPHPLTRDYMYVG